ncbi:MAG TPA: ABC-2 transporter permease [Armatimonadota bacterium]|nr:ABC-2 transporter permease [Armatimonadota bacterium]
MKGLIIKDLVNLKKSGRTILLIIAFYILFAFMVDSMEFLSGMIILMFAISTVSSFSYDSQAGWDTYARTLPLPKKDFVLSKYVLALLLTVSGTLLTLLLNWLFGLFKNESNFTEALITSYAIFAVAVIFLAVMLPLIYRFGAERSRIIIIAVFAIPAAAIVVLSRTNALAAPSEALLIRLPMLLALSPLGLIAVSGISFAISCRIFSRKEV